MKQMPPDIARRLVVAEITLDACAWNLRAVHHNEAAETLFKLADTLRQFAFQRDVSRGRVRTFAP